MNQKQAIRSRNPENIAPGRVDRRTFIRRDHLRRLRNDIDFRRLFRTLNWPWKERDGKLIFVCPQCSESQTSVNPKTNLARCFRCEKNWNPIDFTMEAYRLHFIEAVGLLEDLLPNKSDSASP